MKPPTPRQQQMIAGAAQGMGDSEIARRLGIGRQTVANQLYWARERVGARSRAHLAALAFARGWIR